MPSRPTSLVRSPDYKRRYEQAMRIEALLREDIERLWNEREGFRKRAEWAEGVLIDVEGYFQQGWSEAARSAANRAVTAMLARADA